ncbi:hypothetical protein PG993_008665 [Apiospora rasikravindrae]|uniref:Uncharacterized protein n=1 Tax=Apiospora rasikravindrae TaxID=990691 RepID=A0ABR1SR62_9PEZI
MNQLWRRIDAYKETRPFGINYFILAFFVIGHHRVSHEELMEVSTGLKTGVVIVKHTISEANLEMAAPWRRRGRLSKRGTCQDLGFAVLDDDTRDAEFFGAEMAEKNRMGLSGWLRLTGLVSQHARDKVGVRMLAGFHFRKGARAVCVTVPVLGIDQVVAARSAALLLRKGPRVSPTTGIVGKDPTHEPIGDGAKRRVLGFRSRLHAVRRKAFQVPVVLAGIVVFLHLAPLFRVVEEGLSVSARQRGAEDETPIDGFPQARAPLGHALWTLGKTVFVQVEVVFVPDRYL